MNVPLGILSANPATPQIAGELSAALHPAKLQALCHPTCMAQALQTPKPRLPRVLATSDRWDAGACLLAVRSAVFENFNRQGSWAGVARVIEACKSCAAGFLGDEYSCCSPTRDKLTLL